MSTAIERLLSRISIGEVFRGSRCWIFTGAKTWGYGVIKENRRQVRTHRLAYENLVGPIPDGLDIDHLCRVRACCNPEHLEPKTRRDNVLCGETVAAANAAKTHCPRGHALEGDNLRPDALRAGKRACLACSPERYRDWLARNHEAKKARDRAYHRAHDPEKREERAAYRRRYREENGDRLRARARERSAKNREARAAYNRRYYQEHRDALLAKQREYNRRTRGAVELGT